MKTLELTIKTTLFIPNEFVNIHQLYLCYRNTSKKLVGVVANCWRPCWKALPSAEIWPALSYRQLLFPKEQTLGVAILVHNRFILIHRTRMTLWLQSKTTVKNMLADLLQMRSLTRTHGEYAVNHVRIWTLESTRQTSTKFKVWTDKKREERTISAILCLHALL
jgi:hypothetical protein